MSISGLVEKAASNEADREARGAAEEELASADAIPERAHGDEQAGHQEAVDVDDPEELRARRSQLRTDPRDGEVEHGQVHRVDERGQRQHGKTDPFATGGPRRYHVLARSLTHAPCSLPDAQDPGAAPRSGPPSIRLPQPVSLIGPAGLRRVEGPWRRGSGRIGTVEQARDQGLYALRSKSSHHRRRDETATAARRGGISANLHSSRPRRGPRTHARASRGGQSNRGSSRHGFAGRRTGRSLVRLRRSWRRRRWRIIRRRRRRLGCAHVPRVAGRPPL